MDGYLGEVRMFSGNFEPRGWKFCNGQLLAITQFQALYSIMATTYGGDGRTTFGLPDFRDRCAIGAGLGIGLTDRKRGEKVGVEAVTLTAQQIPSHTHTAAPHLTGRIRCNDQASDHESPVGNTLAVFKAGKNAFNTQAPDSDMHADTVTIDGTVNLSEAGGNLPHTNRQPSLGINFIICVSGLFPPRP
jgi:microcystin-dependent protein